MGRDREKVKWTKSIKVRKEQQEEKKKNTRNGKAEARETQSTNEFSPSFIQHRNWSGVALGPGGQALCLPQVLAWQGGKLGMTTGASGAWGSSLKTPNVPAGLPE